MLSLPNNFNHVLSSHLPSSRLSVYNNSSCNLSPSTSLILHPSISSSRWFHSAKHPRPLSQRSSLVVNTRSTGFAKGGEVFGTLSTNTNSSLVGIVAKGWNDWLLSLAFIPFTPVWIWIFDKNWERILRRLYPSVVFIDGFISPLPSVDILLLSRVTLRQCKITLAVSPFSLVLSTCKLSSSLGWIHKFWPVSHSHKGGSTDGSWGLHSLHRLGYTSSPLWTSFPSLPSGNIRRVVNTTEPGGTPAEAPSTLVDSLDILYPLSGEKNLT